MSRNEYRAIVALAILGTVVIPFVSFFLAADAQAQVPQPSARAKYQLTITGTESDTFVIPIGARTFQVCLDGDFIGTSVTFKSKGEVGDTMVELLDSGGAAVALTVAASKCVSADGETVNILSGDWASLVVTEQTSTVVTVTIRS